MSQTSRYDATLVASEINHNEGQEQCNDLIIDTLDQMAKDFLWDRLDGRCKELIIKMVENNKNNPRNEINKFTFKSPVIIEFNRQLGT